MPMAPDDHRNMRIKYLVLAGVLATALQASAATDCTIDQPVTSELLVQIALRCNAGRQAISSRAQAQQHLIDSADALDDPRLSLAVAPETLGDDSLDDGYIVELSQSVPWPGVRPLRVETSRAQTEAWNARLGQEEVDIALAVRLRFADWLLHRRLLSINARHQRLWDEFIAATRANYVSGITTKSSVLQATSERMLLSREAIELTEMIERDVSYLKEQVNLPPDASIEAAEETPAEAITDKDIGYLLSSLEGQPMIRELDAQDRVKTGELDLALRDRYPTFSVFTRYNRLWLNPEQRWVLGVGINLPFDAGNRSAREDSLKAEQQAIEWARQDLTVRLREEVRRGHSAWRQASQVLELHQKELLPLAEEGLVTARHDYRSGTGDFLSLLTAQRQLLSTQQHTERAVRDKSVQFAKLLAAGGVVSLRQLQNAAAEGTQ